MPKRRAAPTLREESSELSPPPDILADDEDVVERAVAPARSNNTKAKPVKNKKGAASRVNKKSASIDSETAYVNGSTVKTEAVKGKTKEEEVATNGTPKRSRKRKIKAEEATEELNGLQGSEAAEPKPKKRQRKSEVKEEKAELDEDGNIIANKVKRKRKTKEEKEAEAMPLAARTVGHKMFVGAHVSSAGGVQNAVANSVHIGANAFALFLKSQRKWANPPLQDEQCSIFHQNCEKHTYDQKQHIVPHGSYLVNLAHTDKARAEQAYEAFMDDLKRCERLGIKLYNFHPGNSVGNDRAEAIAHLAGQLNKAHRETSTVVTLLENMAAGGNVLGSTFEDLRDTIKLIENKDRIGVCLDTCHAFAAGYDLRAPKAFKDTLSHFDEVVGMKYLRALHLNDSKAPFGAHRDLHANIGTGFLGLRAFHNVANEPRFEGLPLVLETPIELKDDDGVPIKDEKGKEKEDKGIWATEIKLLERLRGMDVEGEEFLALEKALQRKGESERKRLMEQLERKKEKEERKKNSPKKKQAKKAGEETADVDVGLEKDESSDLSEPDSDADEK